MNTALGAPAAKGVNWPIGCLERPWFESKSPWIYDTALDGIKAAGYKLMGLLRSSGKDEPLIGSSASSSAWSTSRGAPAYRPTSRR